MSYCVELSECKTFVLFSRDGFECVCDEGLQGQNCSDNLPDCNHSFCENNSTCMDLVNDYICDCQPGYNGKKYVVLFLVNLMPSFLLFQHSQVELNFFLVDVIL